MNEKNILRNKVLELRGRLSREEIKDKSNSILKKIINLKEFRESLWIMCYMDFKNEVATNEFIHACLEQGKHVAVPVICFEEHGIRKMEASEIFHPEWDCTVGNYGILEPKADCIRIIDPGILDFIVVPGVAFDMHCQRMGYGAGYYDAFLPRTRSGCVKTGAAFELQIFESIPSEVHDVKMDMIITENRIIKNV